MDVDVADERLSLAEQEPRPVQRAKRTYGSNKPKLQTSHSDDNGSSAHFSSLPAPLSAGSSMLSSMATSTTTFQDGGWREKFAKIDQDIPLSDDENESLDTPSIASTSARLSPLHRRRRP